MAPTRDASTSSPWQAPSSSRRVDIVGDFAGKELFGIHGEALIAHCLPKANVDYDGGFQLLHAIHVIERLLNDLHQRGCNFHILWLDDSKDLAVPYGSGSQSFKYHLTRLVLIQHLQSRPSPQQPKSGPIAPNKRISFVFPSVSSQEFRDYTAENALHFIMCGAGWTRPGSHGKNRAVFRNSLVYSGFSVAFIDNIEIRSSKVYIDILTAPPLSADPPEMVPSIACEEFSQSAWLHFTTQLKSHPSSTGARLTTRDRIGLIACATILSEDPEDSQYHVYAFLVHLHLLKRVKLAQRSYPKPCDKSNDVCNRFLEKFSAIASSLIKYWTEHESEDWTGTDLFDLVDGRLYRHAFSNPKLTNLIVEDDLYLGVMRKLVGDDASKHSSPCFSDGPATLAPNLQEDRSNLTKPTCTVLPFSHTIIEKYLADVRLKTDSDKEPDSGSRIFQELTHWHNAKRSIDPKQPKKPLGFFARKRNQKFMADTIAYSASLTNSTGKNIEPETIVVQKSLPLTYNRQSQPQKQKKPPVTKSSGKQAALEAARAVQLRKSEGKALNVVNHWHETCQELQMEPLKVKQYLKMVKYLSSLSQPDKETVGAEVFLYGAQILSSHLNATKTMSNIGKLSVLALAWSNLHEIANWPMNKSTRKYAEQLAKSFKLALNLPQPTAPLRQLPFEFLVRKAAINLPQNQIEYQLEYCGPYLDRSFDPTPDPRVQFMPDAWQRKVLDAIDANSSLFVIAPTSAGKTFISFYAMKKVLQSNDDDVLVYVAPTKALVNQIAAEIQARFSKSYRHDGRSVWAIHTRDYRINSPVGCQILVTVPHILQIMLLAPSHAQKPSSWARRVKRIIFDEVHCIGQADEGVIWEQLLLMAPCPIIALSATVGNPLELGDWLANAQRTKGFKLVTVTHSTRYSDLRKFIYMPPRYFYFDGLKHVERLPLPGLDAEGNNARFSFIHPVISILSKDKGTLDDLSLEARDCLRLWQAMKHHETEDFPMSPSLSPDFALPPTPKKSDVVNWETALKHQLYLWMVDSRSPFTNCRKHLQDQTALRYNVGNDKKASSSDFCLLLDLRDQGGLPAILFNYDRQECENVLDIVLKQLKDAEQEYRSTSPLWKRKIEGFEKWKKNMQKCQQRPTRPSKDPGMTKADLAREAASREQSSFASFNPHDALDDFSFADMTKISRSELDGLLYPLKTLVKGRFIEGLRRGLGVHHAGMNRQYRQVVELLFRRSVLTVVIATGTLALGINMPCKTVVFCGDSPYLTALNYRQASGRAGRRGFDLLGNVVFHKIQPQRAMEIMSARLPDLRGTFPISVTLVLRLFGLLHGTENSEYATQVVQSLFTQTRLYLGGPTARMSIAHHLRFSIEYLRRQSLLSATGVPLNFAGLVGHLYFTENSVFAFHSLLKEGYLHELCDEIDDECEQKDILLELVLILSHLFCRFPCFQYNNKEWLNTVVRSSPSLVILPELPTEAARLLRTHNEETLDIFLNYVRTYVEQHVHTVDDELPFTKRSVAPEHPIELPDIGICSLPATVIRSPFAALSGLTDEFSSIHELVATVRAGVFLDESAIPYIPIYPEETNNVPFNAYLLDFFKHGDINALVRDNGIKRGDIWFHLKDFSLILATIVTSLGLFLDSDNELGDAAMVDVESVSNAVEDPLSSDDESDDQWKSDLSSDFGGSSLVNLYKAMKLVQTEFDEKFKKVWA